MEITLFLAADSANIEPNGKLNILGVCDYIWATRFPYIHPSISLAVGLEAGLGEFNVPKLLKIMLFNEDGQTVLTSPDYQILFTPTPIAGIGRLRYAFTFPQLAFASAGRYEFRAFVNGDAKAELPLDVIRSNH